MLFKVQAECKDVHVISTLRKSLALKKWSVRQIKPAGFWAHFNIVYLLIPTVTVMMQLTSTRCQT